MSRPSFLDRIPLAAIAVLGLTLALAGCGTFNDATRSAADAITLYKPEVVQGNFVSREQVEALRPGMTQLQVRDILGTPLVTSLFHKDRWDYVFTMKRQGVEPQHYRLTVFFDGDRMLRTEGDEMPSETEFVDRISPRKKVKVPQLQATPEQLAKYPAPENAVPPPANPAPLPPAGRYPPLTPTQ